MADTKQVSEKKLSKLIQEKHLLTNRLVVLQRENNPDSNSREQAKRVEQIEQVNKRLVELDNEIKTEKYLREREKNLPVDDISRQLLNLSLEKKSEKKRLGPLEEYIEKSKKDHSNMAPTTETVTSSTDTRGATALGVNTQDTVVTSKDEQYQNNNNSFASSTPKQGGIKTTMSNLTPKVVPQEYNFPPTYESPEDRFARLEREQMLRQQFDRDMQYFYAHSNSGAIPRTQYRTGVPDSNILQQNEYMIRKPEFTQRDLGSQNQLPLNNNNDSWNEHPRKFENYNPTPKRVKPFEHNSANRNSDSYYDDQNDFNFNNREQKISNLNSNPNQQRRVNFDLPANQNYSYNNSNMQNDSGYRSNENFNIQPERNNSVRQSFLKRLKMIPKFSGDSFKELKDFLDISETLFFSCNNEAEEQEFFEYLLLQVRGEARSLIGRMRNLDWENIKSTFSKHFAYLANKNVIQSQLENLHQEKDESLTKYSERARKLLREKNAIYNNLNEDQRNEHNRTARRAFTKGIKDRNLREKMLIRGANSLEDAIAFSIEAENDALLEVDDFELYCKTCRAFGHRHRDCAYETESKTDIGKLVVALRQFGSPVYNRQMSSNNMPNRNVNRNDRVTYGYPNRNYYPPNFNRNNGFNPNRMANNYQNRNSYGGNNFDRNYGNNNNYNRNQYQNNGNGNNFNRNQYQNYNNTGNGYNRNQLQNSNNGNILNRNQNQNNNNYSQNRMNSQQNIRNPQRTNNFIRNARINRIHEYVQDEDQNEDITEQESEN